ncbi:MAG: helix-turn-helix domain-containing protein [Actinomycetia bacterium]|nr:helix-turn-helix domain-containing protein [Actinomycetes bacterium]
MIMNKKNLEALRIKAIKKYLEGKSPQVIGKELSMSKRWLFNM